MQTGSNTTSRTLRNAFLSLGFFAGMMLASSASGQMVAVFDKEQDFLRSGHQQHQTRFTIEADKESMAGLIYQAALMPETLSFATEKVKRNRYQCSILYTHPTDPFYVKKILLALGIKQLKINNVLINLPDYDPVLE